MTEETTEAPKKPETFRVYEGRLNWLNEKVAKLNKRAIKLGCDVIAIEIVAEETEYRIRQGASYMTEGADFDQRWVKEEQVARFCDPKNAFAWTKTGEVRTAYILKLHGATPKLAGWTFIATLNHLVGESGSEVIIKAIPGQEIPEQYRTASPEHCDHCKASRKRKDTFILRHEDGRYAQVGRQCVADFLGGVSPEQLGMIAEMIRELSLSGSSDDEFFGGERIPSRWGLQHYLTVSAQAIRLFGWTSATTARASESTKIATSSDVWGILTYSPTHDPKGESIYRDAALNGPTDADVALGAEAYAWMDTINPQESDYFYNLATIRRLNTVEHKTAGFACSVIVTFMKAKEREIKRASRAFDNTKSTHQGEVGKRQVFEGLMVERIFASDSQYGVSYLYLMRDLNGNIFKWSSSTDALEQGKRYDLKATVKAHTEYKGALQTQITRAAVVKEYEQSAEEPTGHEASRS